MEKVLTSFWSKNPEKYSRQIRKKIIKKKLFPEARSLFFNYCKSAKLSHLLVVVLVNATCMNKSSTMHWSHWSLIAITRQMISCHILMRAIAASHHNDVRAGLHRAVVVAVPHLYGPGLAYDPSKAIHSVDSLRKPPIRRMASPFVAVL